MKGRSVWREVKGGDKNTEVCDVSITRRSPTTHTHTHGLDKWYDFAALFQACKNCKMINNNQ